MHDIWRWIETCVQAYEVLSDEELRRKYDAGQDVTQDATGKASANPFSQVITCMMVIRCKLHWMLYRWERHSFIRVMHWQMCGR